MSETSEKIPWQMSTGIMLSHAVVSSSSLFSLGVMRILNTWRKKLENLTFKYNEESAGRRHNPSGGEDSATSAASSACEVPGLSPLTNTVMAHWRRNQPHMAAGFEPSIAFFLQLTHPNLRRCSLDNLVI